MNFMNKYYNKISPRSLKGGYKFIIGSNFNINSNIKYAVSAVMCHLWIGKQNKYHFLIYKKLILNRKFKEKICLFEAGGVVRNVQRSQIFDSALQKKGERR